MNQPYFHSNLEPKPTFHPSHYTYSISVDYENEYQQQIPHSRYECLLFNVDDTLYPLSSGLSAECTKNIKEYMVKKLDIEESKVLEMCVQLYKDYGTTVAGLRAIGYDFDHDDYHSFVHGRLPFEYLKPDPVLKSILNSLPIRKVIFSNANEAHVAEVLGRLGLGDCFDDVICFESLNSKTQTANTSKSDNEPVGLLPKSPIACKPSENAFQQAFKMANINPRKTLFFDNSIHNIQTAKLTGLTIVLGRHNVRMAWTTPYRVYTTLGKQCRSYGNRSTSQKMFSVRKRLQLKLL
ncbi:putative pyridoxal phosphatase [Helianthus annuus]|nr:putative pyridoxal phosphatase [Helianthus annuus]KAJ0554709.1 putative pyridoxal phosphatase [Helianthus annuus]KAJ0720272.1 putative pyridoxal phosphatase [Helianthus annuus]KAJ0899289.1 putative pyridoxal phosphatase [Helianthus annuus]